jgi:hypothetical protein
MTDRLFDAVHGHGADKWVARTWQRRQTISDGTWEKRGRVTKIPKQKKKKVLLVI